MEIEYTSPKELFGVSSVILRGAIYGSGTWVREGNTGKEGNFELWGGTVECYLFNTYLTVVTALLLLAFMSDHLNFDNRL